MTFEMYAPELEIAENSVEETLVSTFDGEETSEENEPEENEEDELPEAEENEEEAPEVADEEAA